MARVLKEAETHELDRLVSRDRDAIRRAALMERGGYATGWLLFYLYIFFGSKKKKKKKETLSSCLLELKPDFEAPTDAPCLPSAHLLQSLTTTPQTSKPLRLEHAGRLSGAMKEPGFVFERRPLKLLRNPAVLGLGDTAAACSRR